MWATVYLIGTTEGFPKLKSNGRNPKGKDRPI